MTRKAFLSAVLALAAGLQVACYFTMTQWSGWHPRESLPFTIAELLVGLLLYFELDRLGVFAKSPPFE